MTRWRAWRGHKEKRAAACRAACDKRARASRARRGASLPHSAQQTTAAPVRPRAALITAAPRCSTPRPVASFIGQHGIAADRSSSAPCVCALPARTSAAARAASQCTSFCGPPHPSREREPAQAARAGLYDMSEGRVHSQRRVRCCTQERCPKMAGFQLSFAPRLRGIQ